MGPLAIVAGVGAAVSAFGTYKGIKNQKKAVKEQKRANNYQRQQDNLKATRERREAIRSARIATAESTQAAVNNGAENSSASLGALGSITSQVNQGLSFLDAQNSLSDAASIALGKANVFQAKAATWDKVAGFGMTVAQTAAGRIK